MTNPDTSREAVDRLIALYSRQHGNPTGVERRETADVLSALLAERKEAIEFYGLCHEHRVKVEDERDALKAKLAVAVDTLECLERGDDSPDGMAGDIARAALITINADAPKEDK